MCCCHIKGSSMRGGCVVCEGAACAVNPHFISHRINGEEKKLLYKYWLLSRLWWRVCFQPFMPCVHFLFVFTSVWLWVCNRVCITGVPLQRRGCWDHVAERFEALSAFFFFYSELKERLKPELLELIRQQRLNRLCQGTMFRKISSRRRQGEIAHTHTLKKKT